jgi:hypothetical protein
LYNFENESVNPCIGLENIVRIFSAPGGKVMVQTESKENSILAFVDPLGK